MVTKRCVIYAGNERLISETAAQLPSRRWSNNLEPILIYGFPLGSSMGLVAALEWLGKPDRLCRVDMLGEMREPAYARINARHETPEIGRASCRERVCQYV